MKFGKQFEFYKIPEWSEFYFDYSGINSNNSKINNNDENDNNNIINTQLNQSSDNLIIPNEKKPFLDSDKVTLEVKVKTEKILEAQDLSGYSNEEKLAKFIKIYKEKISFINNFFMKKLEEFSQKLENSKQKMDIKNKSFKDEFNMKRTNALLGYIVISQ